jgi:hypothetical protein
MKSRILVLMSLFSVPSFASQELGLGLGFNLEGREEATGDSFVFWGLDAQIAESLSAGLKLEYRNFGATLSENSFYQDRILALLVGARYEVTDRFFVGAWLGPQVTLKSTIVWNPTYSKVRSSETLMGYIPKPEIGMRLPLSTEQGTAAEASLRMSNKGDDLLAALALRF